MVHTEDRVDPVADLEIIHHELRQKDIERMEKVAEGLGKVPVDEEPDSLIPLDRMLLPRSGVADQVAGHLARSKSTVRAPGNLQLLGPIEPPLPDVQLRSLRTSRPDREWSVAHACR